MPTPTPATQPPPHATKPVSIHPTESLDILLATPSNTRVADSLNARSARRLRPSALNHLRERTERGAATAEYAITIVAACGLGGVLVALLRSPVMMNALKALINYALKIAGVEGVHL